MAAELTNDQMQKLMKNELSNDEMMSLMSGSAPSKEGDIPTMTVRPERTMGDYTRDIVKGAGEGLVKGAATVLGIPSDVWQLLDKGYQQAITRSAELAGLLTSKEGSKLREPLPSGLENYALTSDSISNALHGATGIPEYKPQTVPGQYAETIGSFAPGAVAFGAPGAANVPGSILKYGVVPGTVSEAGGQIAKGTEAEPIMRGAGALAGMAPFMVFDALRSPVRPLREAIRNASGADMEAAQKLLDESRAAGAPLTIPEALDFVTNGATSLGDVMRIIEQTATGSPTTRKFFSGRPEQTRALADTAQGEIAPLPADSGTVAPRVQQAARTELETSPQGQALDQSVFAVGPRQTAEETGAAMRPELQGVYDRREGMRAAQADADYTAARNADYGPTGGPANPVQIRPVIDYIDDLLVTAKGPVADALRSARATLFSEGVPDQTIKGLDQARQAITSLISRESVAGDKVTSRLLQDVLGQLDSALERVPAYGQARRNFAANSEPLRPFEEGTVGGTIVEKDQYGRNYVVPTEQVPAVVEKAGATGADQFNAAATPNAKEAFTNYYANRLLDGAKDASGNVDPVKLKNILAENQDVLRRFPDIEARLSGVQQAREAFAALEATPTGQIAKAESFEKQINVLFPPPNSRKLVPGMEGSVSKAVSDIAKTDPEAASQLVRLYTEQALNKAAEVKQGTGNQWAGPRFVASLTGNTQSAENLKAAITALPNGAVRWNAMQKALKIMQAQGMRQAAGSKTAFNEQLKTEMKQGSLAAEVGSHFPSPAGMTRSVAKWFEELRFGRRASEFAKVFTEGDVADLRKLSAAPVGSSKALTALSDVLATRDEEPAKYAKGGSVDAYTSEDNPLSPHLLSIFQDAADRYKVPLPVLLSVARRESNFNPRARGSGGEIGLMQIMPSTAQQPGYGIDPVSPELLSDPRTNIDFGAKYLAAVGRSAGATDLSDPDQLAKALLRYNGGGDPRYVQNVTQYLPYYSENVLPQSGSSVPDVQSVETVPEEIIAPVQMGATDQPGGAGDHEYSPQQVMKVLAYVQQLLGNRAPAVG